MLKTHRLCGATQGHFLSPVLKVSAANTKPGLYVIDSCGPSPQLAKTRDRKVGVWIAGTSVSMVTDCLEIV